MSDRPLWEYGQDAQAHVIPGLAFRLGERQKSENYEQASVRTGQCAALIGGSVWFSKKSGKVCGGGRCPEAIGTFSEAFHHSVVQCVAGLLLQSVLHMYVGHRDHERERERDRE